VHISLFIFASTDFSLLLFCLALAGALPAQAQQQAHLKSLSLLDSGLSLLANLDSVYRGYYPVFVAENGSVFLHQWLSHKPH
jgi:hypothetical protein